MPRLAGPPDDRHHGPGRAKCDCARRTEGSRGQPAVCRQEEGGRGVTHPIRPWPAMITTMTLPTIMISGN